MQEVCWITSLSWRSWPSSDHIHWFIQTGRNQLEPFNWRTETDHPEHFLTELPQVLNQIIKK